ncbi:MAG: type I phosphomannose isomerase catalytic subunit [Bacteroidales bacterium]
MKMLYPLKFKEIYKDKVWGSNRMSSLLNKEDCPFEQCGESWELASLENNVSVVANGFLEENTLTELAEVYMGDLVGDKVYQRFGVNFPLLVKFLDTSDYLSVQVHPDNKVAALKHQSQGKTEMWYVLAAEPDSEIIVGFKKPVTRELFMSHLKNNTLREILNVEKAAAGDVYHLPAGRIHAIGAGITLCEIQQASDVTYRVYDWDRPGMDGKPRELHVDQALEVMDFEALPEYKTRYEPKENGQVNLVKNEFFTTNLLTFHRDIELDYVFLDSFVVYVCLEGKGTIKYPSGKESFSKGDTILLPAEIKNVTLQTHAECKIMEAYIH